MSEQPDHELEVLEDDQTVPPRPEEIVADAGGIVAPPAQGPEADGPSASSTHG